MNSRTLALALALASLALGCAESTADPPPPKPIPKEREEPLKREAPAPHAGRPNLDGHAFPDKVIAMTWDDGPDVNTLKLAEYLSSEHVPATFFVVSEWIEHVSSDPGWGTNVLETGHAYLPILGDLVALGHRLGNHTQNHVLLNDADATTVGDQLRENQRRIDPFLTNELRLFRAPGGAWNAAAAAVVDADPSLTRILGPVAWDVDHKDWENSVSCRSERPAVECERAGPDGRLRVKASVTAHRYLTAIEEMGHGVVLLHDRVGHVGSSYALKIARELIPQLKARGFVFVAPVLQFSPLVVRSERGSGMPSHAAVHLGDIDADGRADVCGRGPLGVVCATSATRAGTLVDRLPRTALLAATLRERTLTDAAGWSLASLGGTVRLADVNGNGHADLCARGADGIVCAETNSAGVFGTLQGWSASHLLPSASHGIPSEESVADFSDAEGWGDDEGYYKTIRFADVDGDRKADVCGRSPGGILCAKSLGNGFDHAHVWLADMGDAQGFSPPAYSTTIDLADVDGDGRADVCGRSKDGIVCALSRGNHFARPRRWSTGADFSDADPACPWAKDAGYYGTIRLADINGDGRADLCGRRADGIVCALSTGRSFTKATLWLRGMTDAEGWSAPESSGSIELGDVNGDGRADLCGLRADGIVCGLAP